MPSVTSTTQLSLFTHIRTALIANATLTTKFNVSNIYQHKPKHKSSTFHGFPYIYVRIPNTNDTEFITLNHQLSEKEFTVRLYLYMEYLARDNYITYSNAILKSIESYEATFDTNGYYNASIELTDTDDNYVEDQKELVRGLFTLSWDGMVDR